MNKVLHILAFILAQTVSFSALSGEDLVTGINIDEFWKAAESEVSDKPISQIKSVQGGIFSVIRVNHRVASVTIGVWATPQAAKTAYDRAFRGMQVGPEQDPLDFGEEAESWVRKNNMGGTIIFRRLNVLVEITWPEDKASGLEFAKTVDDLLKGAANAAVEKGAFKTEPKIVGLPAEVEMAKGEKKTLNVSFEGLNGDPMAVYVCNELPSFFDTSGKLEIDLSATTFEVPAQLVTLMGISKKGVIATGTFKFKPKP